MAKKYVSTYDRVNHSKRNSIIVVVGFVLFFAVIFSLIGLFLRTIGLLRKLL